MADRYTYALGRRKSAVASVRLTKGTGVISVNGKPAEVYFANSESLMHELFAPFRAVE